MKNNLLIFGKKSLKTYRYDNMYKVEERGTVRQEAADYGRKGK